MLRFVWSFFLYGILATAVMAQEHRFGGLYLKGVATFADFNHTLSYEASPTLDASNYALGVDMAGTGTSLALGARTHLTEHLVVGTEFMLTNLKLGKRGAVPYDGGAAAATLAPKRVAALYLTLGYALPKTLLFTKVGVAAAEMELCGEAWYESNARSGCTQGYPLGSALALGFERAIDERWSWGAEVTRYTFSDSLALDYEGTALGDITHDTSFTTLGFFMQFRF